MYVRKDAERMKRLMEEAVRCGCYRVLCVGRALADELGRH